MRRSKKTVRTGTKGASINATSRRLGGARSPRVRRGRARGRGTAHRAAGLVGAPRGDPQRGQGDAVHVETSTCSRSVLQDVLAGSILEDRAAGTRRTQRGRRRRGTAVLGKPPPPRVTSPDLGGRSGRSAWPGFNASIGTGHPRVEPGIGPPAAVSGAAARTGPAGRNRLQGAGPRAIRAPRSLRGIRNEGRELDDDRARDCPGKRFDRDGRPRDEAGLAPGMSRSSTTRGTDGLVSARDVLAGLASGKKRLRVGEHGARVVRSGRRRRFPPRLTFSSTTSSVVSPSSEVTGT